MDFNIKIHNTSACSLSIFSDSPVTQCLQFVMKPQSKRVSQSFMIWSWKFCSTLRFETLQLKMKLYTYIYIYTMRRVCTAGSEDRTASRASRRPWSKGQSSASAEQGQTAAGSPHLPFWKEKDLLGTQSRNHWGVKMYLCRVAQELNPDSIPTQPESVATLTWSQWHIQVLNLCVHLDHTKTSMKLSWSIRHITK